MGSIWSLLIYKILIGLTVIQMISLILEEHNHQSLVYAF